MCSALQASRLAGSGSTSAPKGVIAFEVALVWTYVQVVGVHMFASGDGPRRKTDDLVVAPQRVAGDHGMLRNLVAWRDQSFDRDAFNQCAADQLDTGNQHIVFGVETDKRRHCMMVPRLMVWKLLGFKKALRDASSR